MTRKPAFERRREQASSLVFRDVDAHGIHSQSAEVKKFAATLYPQCVAPAEFINYRHVASKLDVLPQGPLR